MTAPLHDFRKPPPLPPALRAALAGWGPQVGTLSARLWAGQLPFAVEVESCGIQVLPASAALDALPETALRFRANLYVEGWPAWQEFELVDHTLAIGDVRLKVVKRIVRCAAVNVDPDTAARDLAIPTALQRRLGHADCGIYAEVITGGTISDGDAIAAEQPELL